MKITPFVMVGALVAGCGDHAASGRGNKQVSVPQEVSFSMPDSSEIEGLKSIALAGGGREAVRLAAWYMKFPSGPDTFEYWSVIAAENGNDVGQYNVGMLYLKKPLPGYWGARAKYWLERSARQGNKSAQAELERLEAVSGQR
ncbi:hypothetical protein IEQ11_03165 [Lysobacter capsici]|uniref:sel1 repeat family protein n=1 Tax=Lysobacter capsici TaxID=435897 RepID=UPI001783C575|nr:sel1 repeat family protein [Lysobacter capsici]UOF15684.1 hypothetical protein IEQ11_03165 [Lysobacter capsici]